MGTAAGKGFLIIEAAAITMTIFLSLTAYALITKQDFSYLGGFLLSALVVLCMCSFIGIFIPGLVHNVVFAGIGALIFSGYILYDTSVIEKSFGVDDYIVA